jgi:ATP-dependent Clp protease ATP-binding subunit ClpC
MKAIHPKLNDEARATLALAEREARGLRHGYVGTEHVLLALLQTGGDDLAMLLRIMGLSPDGVRQEIARIVTPGPQDAAPAANAPLPLTPRVSRSIESAAAIVASIGQKQIGTKHLLLGLFKESDGIAAKVMLNLGLKPDDVRAEMLKVRLGQMRIVERVVRPVHAGTPRKLKMREELLAHVSEIYDQELARLNDPPAAMAETTARFGDPSELTAQFQRSLSTSDRLSYHLERWFGWRAPESAARYTLRVAGQVFIAIAAVCAVLAVGAFFDAGRDVAATWRAIRPAVGILLVAPVDMFLLGWLYFKTRDAIFGPTWSRKSLMRAVLCQALAAVITIVSVIALTALAQGELRATVPLLERSSLAATAVVGMSLFYMRRSGPSEIAHTIWASLELKTDDRAIAG